MNNILNEQLPEIPEWLLQERMDNYSMDSLCMVCDCVFYNGYRVPPGTCECFPMPKLMAVCHDCGCDTEVSNNYKGRFPRCQTCCIKRKDR